MNPREALRLADPATRLDPARFDDGDDDLLRQILGTEVDRDTVAKTPRAARAGRPAIVTAIVAVAVVVGAVVAIRSVPASPVPAGGASDPTSATEGLLVSAIDARLVEAAGDESVRNGPSLTWSEEQLSPIGGPIDLTGKRMYLAAACTGGGSIAIAISGRPDVVLGCGRLSTVGPIDLTAMANGSTGIGVDVRARTGHPAYIARAVAVSTDALPRNARGQTYGPDTGTQHPDLIAALATNGRQGYISAKEEAAADPCGNVKTPAEAVTCTEDHAGQTVTIPVYESDGTTRIGVFRIG